ncbi:MAG: hypothetical protein V5A72_01845 [Candidatus Nanohaloarchaea archaeon]
MSLNISEFLQNFNPSKCERLDDGQSFRSVYSVEDSVLEELGNGGEYVVKHVGEDNKSFSRTQNRNEVRAYLESIERNQDFLPPVKAGTTDFDYIVARRVNPLPTPSLTHPWKDNPKRRDFEQKCRNVLPEGWTDNDDTELGVDGNDLKIMDGGALYRKDWKVDEILNHDLVNNLSNSGSEYFVIEI